MANYLLLESSAEEAQMSVFADYTLGTSELLPHYFGDIARVNIFLGENNSGKSRFMRGIMKTDPAQLFDSDFSSEKLTALVNAVLNTTAMAFDAKLYDVEVQIQPAASGQPRLMEMLSIQNHVHYDNNKLKFTPCTGVEEIRSIIDLLMMAASTPKGFLDLQSTGGLKKALEDLQKLANSLKRVAKIYQALGDRHFNGFSPHAIDNNVISFAGQYGRITFHAGNDSRELQNLTGFRQNLSKEVFTALNDVASSIIPFVKFLLPLQEGVTKSLARTYIPTLRTARTLTTPGGNRSHEDVMESTISADYELGKSRVVVHTRPLS